MLKIWSKRWSVARGNYWQYERDSLPENVQAWLKIFRDDEPNVCFIASARKPSK